MSKKAVAFRRQLSRYILFLQFPVLDSVVPAAEGLCNRFGNVAGALLQTEDGGGDLLGDGPVELQTADHSLPAVSGLVVQDAVDLETVSCFHDVLGADGSGLGRNCPDVAGGAHGGEEGVLGDGEGGLGHDAGAEGQELLERVGSEFFRAGIDEGSVSGPAGRGVDNVSAAAAEVFDHAGVDAFALVLVGVIVPVADVGAQVLTDLAVEMVDEGIAQAGAVGDGRPPGLHPRRPQRRCRGGRLLQQRRQSLP